MNTDTAQALNHLGARLIQLSGAQAQANHDMLRLILDRLSRIERQLQNTQATTTTEDPHNVDL